MKQQFNSSDFWKRVRTKKTNPNKIDFTPSLTKTQLEELNVLDIVPANNQYGWEILRTKGKTRTIPISTVTTQKFDNGAVKQYPFVSFYIKETQSQKAIALSRVLYAWFNGSIPKGYVVDHIDNDPFNNQLENLQIITRSENTKKNAVYHNQYTPKNELLHQPKETGKQPV